MRKSVNWSKAQWAPQVYKWDVPQTFYTKPSPPNAHGLKQVAPLISVWQESGKLQRLRIMKKSEQSRYKIIGLKTSLRV